MVFWGLCTSLLRQVLGRFLAFGFLKKFELSPRKTATLEGMIKKEFFEQSHSIIFVKFSCTAIYISLHFKHSLNKIDSLFLTLVT
jgi:hypothetical protein